ncbi:hypothetical protein AVEN_137187-1, partial [Araneus ventricosus]
GRVKIDDDKSCSEPEVHKSDELNLADEQEGQVRIDDGKTYSEPEDHMSDELNSANEQEEKKKSERLFDEYRSFSDSDVNVPDQHNLSDQNEKAAVKYEKYTANRNESSDEWEMPSSDSCDESEMHTNTSNDYHNSSDSSDDYE